MVTQVLNRLEREEKGSIFEMIKTFIAETKR